MLRKILLWLVITAVAVAIWLLLPNTFWQYVFFLRIPLLMGFILLALPLIAKFVLPSILKNLFVLGGIWQIAFTILGATVAGMAVTFVFALIIGNAPARFGVSPLPTFSSFWHYALIIVLALPTTLTVINLSAEEVEDEAGLEGQKRWIGLGLGITFSVAFLFVFKLVRSLVEYYYGSQYFLGHLIAKVNHLLVGITSLLTSHSSMLGYLDPKTGELTRENLNAFIFLSVLIVVYLLFFWLYKPSPQPSNAKAEAPALLYVMLLIAIATLFLGGLTFFFDYSRISVLFFWLVFTGLMYTLLNVDHFFDLTEDPDQSQETTDFSALLQKRLNKQDLADPLAKQTFVMVCASGGGIQAAGWTTQVLTGLQQELGESFTKAIGLLSSVSGGSVGAMYYLDRFTDQGFPPATELKGIFNSATADGLDAVGWGLTYPDLWRLTFLPILPPLFTPKIRDRGIALETNFQGEMKMPASPKTLAFWRQQLENGNIPLPVLNSTLVENGKRLLITPANFPNESEKQFFNFNTLYPKKDINITTAARLSATFPYVSPTCRDNQNLKRYHAADGGYFDNSGFVTGLEWLSELLTSPSSTLKRVLILQINPFPKNDSSSQPSNQPPGNQGLLMATLGPLMGIFGVRSPILKSRNSTDVELLKHWQRIKSSCEDNGVEVHYYPIFFPSLEEVRMASNQDRPAFYSGSGEYQPPLSWKLTQKEKAAICRGWEKIKDGAQINDLRTLWKTTWNMQ